MKKVLTLVMAGFCFLSLPLSAAEIVTKMRPLSTRPSAKAQPRKLDRMRHKIIRESKEFEQEMGDYKKDFDKSIQEYEKLAAKYSKKNRDYTILMHLFGLTKQMINAHYSCFMDLLDITQSNRKIKIKSIDDRRKFIGDNVYHIRALKETVRLCKDIIPEHNYLPFVLVTTNNTKMALMEYTLLDVLTGRHKTCHE